MLGTVRLGREAKARKGVQAAAMKVVAWIPRSC